jgi:hypothetical protein
MKTAPVFVRVALLVLVFAGIGAWAWRSFGPAQNPPAAAGSPGEGNPPPEAGAPAHQVLVTYFTTDQRCPTCLKIEKQTREAIQSAFADQLASGEVLFRTTNFDRDENKHFIKDYELSFKTVVISDRRSGKETAWEKFDEVWDLVGKPNAFAACLQEGVRKYLKDDSDA